SQCNPFRHGGTESSRRPSPVATMIPQGSRTTTRSHNRRCFLRRSFVLMAAIVAAAALSSAAEAQQGVQRYVRFDQNGTVRWGHLAGETIHPLTDAPYLGGTMVPGEAIPLNTVTLKAPADPRNVYMTASNFRSPIPGAPAEHPGHFLVPPQSIPGPEADT